LNHGAEHLRLHVPWIKEFDICQLFALVESARDENPVIAQAHDRMSVSSSAHGGAWGPMGASGLEQRRAC
jgi:hypothetical protein